MSQQINLYNPVFLRQKKYFSAVTMLQALALVAAGSVLVYSYAIFRSRDLQRLAVEMDPQVRAVRDQLLGFGGHAPQDRSKLLLEEIARLEARLQQREGLLASVHASVAGPGAGFSPYLSALARQSTDGVWLTGVSISGNGVLIKGRALDADRVPAYIRALNREAVIEGRQILELALAAKEEVTPPAPQENAPIRPSIPSRYIEFSMSLSGAPARPGKPASKEAS